MVEIKTGKFVADVGQFYANTGKTDKDTLITRMHFRIVSDPNNISTLSEIQASTGLGRIWTHKNSRICGWSVENVAEMLKLYTLLSEAASRAHHHRSHVIEAWGACLLLLPTILKPKLRTSGKKYDRDKWAKERLQAVMALVRANQISPPAFRVLPADYFELWT